jgi:hypothetical protein
MGAILPAPDVQQLGQLGPCEPAPQLASLVGRTQGHVIVVEPEAHLVAWLDSELVAQILGDHHLAFGTHPMSHTEQYNQR